MRQQAQIIRFRPGSRRCDIRHRVLKRALARRADGNQGPSASAVRMCGACGGVWELRHDDPRLEARNGWAFCPVCVSNGNPATRIHQLEKWVCARDYRFCKICLGRTPRELAWMNWPGWVCRACWVTAQQLGPGNAVEAMGLAAPDVHAAELRAGRTRCRGVGSSAGDL